jgi:hypothetical protein
MKKYLLSVYENSFTTRKVKGPNNPSDLGLVNLGSVKLLEDIC